jgi:rhodanese-related sulfurtransferase
MFYKTNEEQIEISIEEFVNEWKDQQEYLLVDIRENSEIETEGSIKGAYNISMYDIPENIEMAPTYIVCIICCTDGTRSEQVTKYIKNNGYNNMFYIGGGIEELFKAVPELKG